MAYGNGNPQLEDGFARIANEILDALARTALTDYESRCIHYLWRKTYGWHNKSQPDAKKEDIISYSQWAAGTGIERRALRRVLSNLVSRHIFTKNPIKLEGKNALTVWAFQKRYLKWAGYNSIQSSLELGAEQPPLTQEEGAGQPPPTHKEGAEQPPLTQEEGAGQPPPRHEVGASETKVGAPQPPEVGAPQPPTIDNKDNTNNISAATKGTDQEEKILGVFQILKVWKFDHDEDLKWLRELIGDFPDVSLLQIKACRDYFSEKPTKNKGPWKNRIRHWLEHEKLRPAKKPVAGTIASSEELDQWEN